MVPQLNPRGAALFVTMVAVAILMLLVAGAIRFTGLNRDAAASKVAGDEVASCAEAARRYLVSRFRTFGVTITDLSLDAKLPDSPIVAEQTQMYTGHYGATSPAPTIVAISTQAMGAARRQARDVANTLGATTLGGSYYRVVVTCRQPTTRRETELEFTFRHGL